MITLTKLSETSTTITLGWTPVVGCTGYRFTSENQAKPSHTWDASKSSVKFSKGSAWYKVEALGVEDEGSYPSVTPPPPPPTGLKWAAPTLSSPQTIQVSASNRSVDLQAGKDYIIKFPSTPITGMGGVTIRGGRNIVVKGGEIFNDNDRGCGAPNDGGEYGLLLESNTGVVHIEGLWVHGKGIGQALLFSNNWTPAEHNLIVQVQNCRFEALHKVSSNGVHTDGIQSWHGPHTLRMFNVTIISQGVCIQTQPFDVTEDNQPLADWHYENVDLVQLNQSVNCVEGGSPHHTYALWKWGGTQGQASAKWPEFHKNIYLSTPETDASGQPDHYTAWASVGMPQGWAGWNPGGSWPITGEAIKLGKRPGGNFVPVGAAGTGYV